MLDAKFQETLIIAASIISIIFGLFNAWWVLRIKVSNAEGVDDEEENIATAIPQKKL
jgi:hypothetical protein